MLSIHQALLCLALVSEELFYKIKGLLGVRWVLPDSYLNVREKDYGVCTPQIDGKELFCILETRTCLSYKQLSTILANNKELNSQNQETLRKAEEFFGGTHNKDLYR